MEFQTQYTEINAHSEILDEFDAAIPNRTISVKEAAFKYANGLPLDSFFHQPTNIPMRYDVFDILDRGNAYKRDFILGENVNLTSEQHNPDPVNKSVEEKTQNAEIQ